MVAYGALHIKPWELIEYSVGEFLAAWYGYHEGQRIERLKTYLVMAPHLGEKSNLKPEKLWKIHGDVSSERSEEDRERLINQAKEKWNGKG